MGGFEVVNMTSDQKNIYFVLSKGGSKLGPNKIILSFTVSLNPARDLNLELDPDPQSWQTARKYPLRVTNNGCRHNCHLW